MMDFLREWFDPSILGRGLVIAVGVSLPITLATAAADLADGSPWAALSLLAILVTFFVAGFVAGGRIPERALSHGAVIGLAGFVIVQVVLLPVSLFSDDGFDTAKIPGLVFVAFLLSNVSMVGGLLGSRMARRSTP
ncbi:MAG: hypothetical protein ACR2QE_17085 [Acidimicrobiales bacterium]